MLGKTHTAVGVATALVLLQPKTIPELVLGAGTAAIGSVISDIDCSSSKSSKRATKIILAVEIIAVGMVLAEAIFHLGLYQKLMNNSSAMRIFLALAVFFVICVYGKKTQHRTFMHSLLSGALLTGCVAVLLPALAPYFGTAFVSHLALDLLNYKGQQLLYPARKFFRLGLCTASGVVNQILLVCGSIAAVGIAIRLLIRIVLHR